MDKYQTVIRWGKLVWICDPNIGSFDYKKRLEKP